MANMKDIPVEVLENMHSNLPFFDLLNCQPVCKRWESLFFFNARTWHYDGVVDAIKSTPEGVHRLLQLYSGPGGEFNTAYQLVAFAKGRLLPKIHVYALASKSKCSAEFGLGCKECQKQKIGGTIPDDAVVLSEPVVLTDSLLLDEPLFYHKSVGNYGTLQVERTEQEQVFYDWMQPYHISLTHGSERLLSYNTACDPYGNANLETIPIAAHFDLTHPKYSGMTVGEFTEDAWDDFKSMIWTKHQITFNSGQFSAVTIALRESEEDGGFWCWFFCWRGRPIVDDPASPELVSYLQGTEYVLKLYKTMSL
ncbi:uncharacterized protein DFL_004308 [Arthrobotrys flagrans]|uniref:F-box domain-containing protein n=1 Tax=Arthrobotrys flagrans TaxID=97331 RepID=A0A437A4A9_ARTFL|nr:hypothetical protein DFL_004308 [Arthrobotrys flagrans]